MNCFDCVVDNEPVPAVGICAVCGAAVCSSCAYVGSQFTRHATGFSSAENSVTETRLIACEPCVVALTARHAGQYRFEKPDNRVRQLTH